jgi:50S ribosomal protein uL3
LEGRDQRDEISELRRFADQKAASRLMLLGSHDVERERQKRPLVELLFNGQAEDVVARSRFRPGPEFGNKITVSLVESVPPTRILKEIRLTGEPDAAIGDQVKVDVFADGDKIEVVGRSKGRGFAGTIKRHNFSRGPESHGSMNVRRPGSIGQSAYPSRVIKGTRSSGHMGDDRVTVKGLTVARVDAENNLLMVRGAVPGANGSLVVVRKS